VTLFARDGSVWMNQNQLAELFDTSKQNIGQYIANIYMLVLSKSPTTVGEFT
jgi:hypothetical protein